MTNTGDALFGALSAAWAKRIGSHVDVRAIAILMCEPGEIASRERLLQCNDTLLCLLRALRAQQESDGFARSEAPGEKIVGDLAHEHLLIGGGTANATLRVLAEKEARWLPGLFRKEEGPMRPLPR